MSGVQIAYIVFLGFAWGMVCGLMLSERVKRNNVLSWHAMFFPGRIVNRVMLISMCCPKVYT